MAMQRTIIRQSGESGGKLNETPTNAAFQRGFLNDDDVTLISAKLISAIQISRFSYFHFHPRSFPSFFRFPDRDIAAIIIWNVNNGA